MRGGEALMSEEMQCPFNDKELDEIGFAIGTIVGAVDLVTQKGMTIFPKEIFEQIIKAQEILNKYKFTDKELMVFFNAAFSEPKAQH
jgi:hypothetical protein